MTIDKAKLKALAQAVADLEDIPEREDEHAEAVDALWLHMHCHTILGLLAEIEGLHAQHGRDSGELRKLCSARDSARRQRDQLKAELGKVEKDRSACWAEFKVQGRRLDELKAENEALRKDALRYRWLRDECGVVAYKEIAGSIGPGMLPSGEKLEAAIDAAKEREACHV